MQLKAVDKTAPCTCYVSIAGDYTDIGACKRHAVAEILLNNSKEYSAEDLAEIGYSSEIHGAILSDLSFD